MQCEGIQHEPRSFSKSMLAVVVVAHLLVMVDAMGTNELGFARTGPLEPLLYPSSVSIVVPCYNCAEFVLLAFESFERSFDMLQSLVHRLGTRPVECEVVVVDDKSTDNSVAVLQRFLDPSGVWAGKACSEVCFEAFLCARLCRCTPGLWPWVVNTCDAKARRQITELCKSKCLAPCIYATQLMLDAPYQCVHPPPKYKLLVHSENRGAGVTRNDGVAAAGGQIILFGESDDVFYEHHAAVCWNMMRQWPNVGFIKMRMDAGKEYVESSFVAHQAPVQTLHPHWQVAIEDTSPMNLCIRRDAHRFIGGYPDGELFHMDMEDGAYMMCLYEAYAGIKWLSSPSTLYVRRVDNGLDRRMLQFTNEPGSVALGEQDAKYGDQRMDLIDGNLALVRDNLAEYQAMDELLALDPLQGDGRELHRQRALLFGHAYGVPRAAYTTSAPCVPPPGASGVSQEEFASDASKGAADGGAGVGGEDWWRGNKAWNSRYSTSEPKAVAVLYRGCRPRRLRNMLAWLMYGALANPMRLLLFLDQPESRKEVQSGAGGACADTKEVGQMFPIHVRTFQGQLPRQNLAARAVQAVAATIAASGGAGGLTRGSDIVILFELAHESRSRSALAGQKFARPGVDGIGGAGADGTAGGLGSKPAVERDKEDETVVVDYCRDVAKFLTPDRLATAAAGLSSTGFRGGPADPGEAHGASAAWLASRLASHAGTADDSESHDESHGDGRATMPEMYEHFWGSDFRFSPAPDSDRHLMHLSPATRSMLHEPDRPRISGEERAPLEDTSRAGWSGFKVLSSTSVSAAKVCNELLRDKSAGGGAPGQQRPEGPRQIRGNHMGCCVVRRV